MDPSQYSKAVRMIPTKSRGFTLVEALVATSIMTFGILGAAIAMRMVNDQVQSSRTLDDAVSLARTKLDSAIAEPNAAANNHGESGRYTWEVSRTPAGGMSNDPLTVARVTVRWQDHSADQEFVLAQAYLRQPKRNEQ